MSKMTRKIKLLDVETLEFLLKSQLQAMVLREDNFTKGIIADDMINLLKEIQKRD